jgi:hypothetical protein
MTSIYDIPRNDIETFILNNNRNIPKYNTDVYDLAFTLINDQNAKGHTRSIAEWMKAYNLVQNNVNIPTYTTLEIDNMNEKKLNTLARMLTMKSNNVETIKNILRYLHKLDVKHKRNPFETDIEDVNYILLNTFNIDNLNNLKINNKYKEILNDRRYWKFRLNNKLKLFVKNVSNNNDNNFDYQAVVKLLDNGKSINDNYKRALFEGNHQIVKLLLDNKAVEDYKDTLILNFLTIEADDLEKIKNYPYDKFIQFIVKENNKLEIDEENEINESYFDEIVYTGKTMEIILNERDETQEKPYPLFVQDKLIIERDDGITSGEILYNIAKLLPSKNEQKNILVEYITNSKDQILEKAEEAYRRGHISHKLLNKLIEMSDESIANLISSKLQPYYFIPSLTNFFDNLILEGVIENHADEDEEDDTYHLLWTR